MNDFARQFAERRTQEAGNEARIREAHERWQKETAKALAELEAKKSKRTDLRTFFGDEADVALGFIDLLESQGRFRGEELKLRQPLPKATPSLFSRLMRISPPTVYPKILGYPIGRRLIGPKYTPPSHAVIQKRVYLCQDRTLRETSSDEGRNFVSDPLTEDVTPGIQIGLSVQGEWVEALGQRDTRANISGFTSRFIEMDIRELLMQTADSALPKDPHA